MSKSITIPGVWGDPVAVVVNGKAYSYRAGATETVPDEVAAAIENALANAPQTEGYVADSVLPPIKAADKGKVLTTDETTGTPMWGDAGGGVLVVHDEEGTLDKTWQEIHDAGFAVLNIENDIGYLYRVSSSDGYEVAFFTVASGGSAFDDPLAYTADTADGYPTVVDESE